MRPTRALPGIFACLLALPAALVPTRRHPIFPAAQAAPDTTIEKVMLAPDIYLFRAPHVREHWTATNTVVIILEAHDGMAGRP